MIFNIEKNANRYLIDTGDVTAYLLNLSATSKFLDKATLASIVAVIGYLTTRFDEAQPKEKNVLQLQVPELFLSKEITRIYKKNQHLSKRSGEVLDFDDEHKQIEEAQTAQLLQIHELLTEQKETLSSIIQKLTQPKEQEIPKQEKTVLPMEPKKEKAQLSKKEMSVKKD